MGSFVSLLPRPPAQTFAQAFEQGGQQALNARNLMAEEGLRQQQAQAAKLQNWAAQKQQESQQALLDAYKQAADIYSQQQTSAPSSQAAPSAPASGYMTDPSGLRRRIPVPEASDSSGVSAPPATAPYMAALPLSAPPATASVAAPLPTSGAAPTTDSAASGYMAPPSRPLTEAGTAPYPSAQGGPQASPSVRSFQDVLMDTLAKNPLAAMHIPAIQAAQIAHQESQLALAGKQVAMLGSLAGSVTDEPTKIGALNAAVASGLLTQDEAHRYAAVPYQDLKPQLASWQQQALGAAGQIETAQKNATHALAMGKFGQEVAEKAPKTADQWLSTTSPLLQSVHDQASLDSARAQMTAAKVPDNVLSLVPETYNSEAQQQLQGLGLSAKEQPELQENEQRVWAMRLAGATSPEDYARKFARVPAGLAPFFVQPEDWGKGSNDLNLKVGANPISVLQQESIAAWRNLTASQRQERIDQLGQALTDREKRSGQSGETFNSQAADRRQALTDYRKLQLQEQTLNKQRIQLGQAAEQQKKTGQAPTDKDGTPRDLNAEFEQATDRLSEVLADKYAAAGRAGMGTPTVSLDDALKAIGRAPGGSAPPPGPVSRPQAPPQVPRAASHAIKTFPRNRLADFAQQNGLAAAEAERRLKAQGYAVQ